MGRQSESEILSIGTGRNHSVGKKEHYRTVLQERQEGIMKLRELFTRFKNDRMWIQIETAENIIRSIIREELKKENNQLLDKEVKDWFVSDLNVLTVTLC